MARENYDPKKKGNDQCAKGKREFNKGEKTPDISKMKRNDPSWYKLNEQLAKDVFNIPFNVFPGTREQIFPNGANYGLADYYDESGQTTPGVLALKYAICPGHSSSATSAVNIAAQSLYSFVRSWNSGHSNYEASDLMVYILALAEVFSSIFEARRIYRTAMTYSAMNRNIPNLLLKAFNVDAESIRGNLAQFRAGINLRIAKLSSLAVPNIFTLFKRQAYLGSSVFFDSTSKTSQIYAYVKDVYHVFDPTHEGGGALIAHTVSSERTYQQVLAEIDEMLDPLLEDEDTAIMSGDILKAFGASEIYVLTEQPENEALDFIFDENYLNCIHNSCAVDAEAEELNITQLNNIIQFEIVRKLKTDGTDETAHKMEFMQLASKQYYNSYKDEPTIDDVIEGTRSMMCFGSTSASGDTTDGILSHGTEVTLRYELYYIAYGSQLFGSGIRSLQFTNVAYIGNDPEKVTEFANRIVKYSKFDWAPRLLVFNDYPVDQQTTFMLFDGILMDLKRYTILAPETVARMNDMAVMAQLGSLLLEEKKARRATVK